jgi:hypothetical protein
MLYDMETGEAAKIVTQKVPADKPT